MGNRLYRIWMMISVLLIVSMACSVGFMERFRASDAPEEPALAEVFPDETPVSEPLPASTPTPIFTTMPIEEGPLEIGSTKINSVDGAVMVYVPEGEFLMGRGEGDFVISDAEKPEHFVYLDAYWVYQTAVTNAQFTAFIQNTEYQTTAEERGWSVIYQARNEGAYWGAPDGPGSSLLGREDHPVVHVTWYDAKAYCEWAGGRLPTEAEWEKAARGTDDRIFPWGNERPVYGEEVCSFSNYRGCGTDETSPVGSYPDGVSPFGALDMAGNVFEWISDWFDWDYYSHSPYENPAGPTSGLARVIRGGSWINDAGGLRVSSRYGREPDDSSHIIGFRCVHSP